MNRLKDLADQSVKGIKHEIYGKVSTGGNVATGAPAVTQQAPAQARVVQGEPLDTRF